MHPWRFIRDLPPLLLKYSFSSSSPASLSSQPLGIHISFLPKKSHSSTPLPISNYLTIFNLPFTAKPFQRVIYMHSHHFLLLHSLLIPPAIWIPPPIHNWNYFKSSQWSPCFQNLSPHLPWPLCSIRPCWWPVFLQALLCPGSPPALHFSLQLCPGPLPSCLYVLFIYYLMDSDISSHNFLWISPKSIFWLWPPSKAPDSLPYPPTESTPPLAISLTPEMQHVPK